MKNTIKTLYDIEAKSLVKYSNKVYKIKDKDDNNYCLKYVDNAFNNNLIEKINALNLDDKFVVPLKTCIRTTIAQKNHEKFYITKWIDDDYLESKDLKLKYYLKQIAIMHSKTSYTLNVTESYFSEISMKLEEDIEDVYQSYEKIIYNLERKEYKSPFEWYFINHFNIIVKCLDNSRMHLENFKKLVKNKETIRQVINHLNFSYDHVFLSKDKIIGNDKMKLMSPVFEIKSLFDTINFGNLDISGLFDEYLNIMDFQDYEIEWMLSLLFISKKFSLVKDDMKNLNSLMQIMFRCNSVFEFEKRFIKEKK